MNFLIVGPPLAGKTKLANLIKDSAVGQVYEMEIKDIKETALQHHLMISPSPDGFFTRTKRTRYSSETKT